MGITKVFRHAKFELSDAIARARTRYCRHWAELAGHARVLDLALLEDRVLLSASPAGGLVQAIQPAEGLGPEAVLTGGTQGDASAISVSESANCNEQPGSNSAIQAGTVDHTSMRRSPSPTDDAQEDPDNPRIVDDHLVQFDVHIVDSSNTPLLAPRHELVILDSNIQQVSELRDYVSQQHQDGRSLEIVVLDSGLDGVQQISDMLAGKNSVDAIHFMTHASVNGVLLGNSWVSAETIESYANQIQGWGGALSSTADLLFYGCELAGGEGGRRVLESIAALTGADVAASTNLTGHDSFGADWRLEYTLGSTESSVAVNQAIERQWLGILANTAPQLDATKSPELNGSEGDAGAPSGSVGTLVRKLVDFTVPAGQLDNVTDPDAGALLGIAVVATDTSNGTWYYSTDDGAHWNEMGLVANNKARLLAADLGTRLYFRPNADFQGTLTAALTFRAWDQTSGKNGETANTTNNGGTRAFSSTMDTASLTVVPAHDAGIHVDPVTGLTTTEAGGIAEFSVVLATRPTSEVTIALSVSDSTEGTISNRSVTFTSANWNIPQKVTITGLDDTIDDDFTSYSVITSAAVSADPLYSGLDVSDVLVTNLDNDGTVTFASRPGLSFQTSGQLRPSTSGDWYTTRSSSSALRAHLILIEVTDDMLTAGSGMVTITVNDADSTNGTGPPDAVHNGSDPTRFRLLASDRSTVVGGLGGPNDVTVPSGTSNGFNIKFTVDAPGVYYVESVTGSAPLGGSDAIETNNDDNGFTITISQENAIVGIYQGTMQQESRTIRDAAFYFLVGPGPDGSLFPRNFDLDNIASVNYGRPDGSTIAGTVSGNGVWNGPHGTLNNGQDTVALGSTLSSSGGDAGLWTYQLTGWTPNNQLALEVNVGANRLILLERAPTRAGNFTISSDGTMVSSLSQPVDHTFSVTNQFFTSDIVNFSTVGTSASCTVQLLDSMGDQLRDNDGDGRLDSGVLAAGETKSFILRVAPDAGFTSSDNTTIQAVSFMDQKIDPVHNTTRSIVKTTLLGPEVDLNGGDAGLNYAATFVEDGGPVRIVDDTALTVRDPISSSLASATVQITNLLDGTAESLAADTTGTSIQATYNFATGVLTLEGTDSLAHFQQVLRTVAYDNISQNPDPTSRVIEFHVTDGVVSNAPPAVTVLTMVPVNDAPVITSNGGGSGAVLDVAENTIWVTAVTAADVDGIALVFSISGGADASSFTIDSVTGTLAFSVAPNYEMPGDFDGDSIYEVGVQVSDGDGGTDTQLLTVFIRDTNEFDVGAIRDSDDGVNQVREGANRGTPVGITAFATDPDGTMNTVTYSLDDDGGGLFEIDSGTGVVTVADATLLALETAPTRTIVARATSTDSSSSTQTFLITIVQDSTSPPVATADSYEVNEDTTLAVETGGVLANDLYSNSNALMAVLVSGPRHGTMTFQSDGTFNYAPDANFHGADSFIYKATAGLMDSAEATVTIAVTPVNDTPVALADTASVQSGSTLSIPGPGVLLNDFDVDHDLLTATLLVGPIHGELTLRSDGSYVYTPHPDFVGSDSFTYTASDESSGAIGTVIIQVHARPFVQPVPPQVTVPETPQPIHDPLPLPPPLPLPKPVHGPGREIGRGVDRSSPTPVSQAFASHYPIALADHVQTMVVGPAARGVGQEREHTSFVLGLGIREAVHREQNLVKEGASFVLETTVLCEQLDALRLQIRDNTQFQFFTAGIATALSSVLTAGYVLWTIRSGYLIASVLTSLPAWSIMDPLPILGTTRQSPASECKDTKDEDSLESMVQRPRGKQ